MIQILLGLGAVAAAGYFLSGCNDNKSSPSDGGPIKHGGTDASPTTLPSVTSFPSPDGGVAPPAPTYVAAFGPDLKSSAAYQSLSKLGVAPILLDQGCPMSGTIFGKGDLRVEACEVKGFALDNFSKYKEAVGLLFSTPLPWVLDDENPSTNFDQKIRDRVDEAVKALQDTPKLKDIPAFFEKHQELLATGLFYFVDFPQKLPQDPKALQTLKDRTQEMETLGLKEFRDYLFEKGGLGTSEFASTPKGDPYFGALEALQKKQGSDFSKSAILFGVFHLAGLKPSFSKSQMKFSHPEKEFELHEGHVAVFKDFYSTVTIRGLTQSRTFNLATLESQTKDPAPLPWSNVQFFGNFLYGQGADWLIRRGQFKEGIPFVEDSLNLMPTRAASYLVLGVAFQGKNVREAEVALREALRINPEFGMAHLHLGTLLYSQKKTEEAFDHFLKALESPDWRMEYDRERIIIQSAQDILKRDPNDTKAKKIIEVHEKLLKAEKDKDLMKKYPGIDFGTDEP